MDNEIVEEVTGWDARSFSDGYDGLGRLVTEEFTGAATNGMAWLFLLNGRIVAAVDGSIEAFAEASGTAYEASSPAVPLLFAMQELGGETRAKYYTEETPLSEVNETLEEGGFTGYVELSENVLSGDYYLVYHGGRSLACAFVGNSRSLVTGEEAFERAADEVGIYEVRNVSIDVIELPEGSGSAGAHDATAAGDAEGMTAVGDATVGNDAESGLADEADDGEFSDETGDHGSGNEVDDGGSGNEADDRSDDETDGQKPDDEVDGGSDGETSDAEGPASPPDRAGQADDGLRAGDSDLEGEAEDERDSISRSSESRGGGQSAETGGQEVDGAAEEDSEDPFSQEAHWRETQTIPSLDPDNSLSSRTEQPGGGTQRQSVGRSGEGDTVARDRGDGDLHERIQELEAAREEAQAAQEQLAAENEELQSERDQLRQRAQRLANEVEELETEVERLESELREARAGQDGTPTRTLTAAEALAGTNLFVRYDTKGKSTLEDAHAGDADRDTVVGNLRLEHHTSFETEGLRVAGDPFETFLEGTVEYRFVCWLVERLLYEIRDTGNESGLKELFDAIPEIDRAELHGSIELEDGSQHEFDIVLRDRMGEPLVVANLNASRDPASVGMMEELIERARDIREGADTLGSAMLVTTSYFEPEAMEAATDATGGGLLDRGKRKSFVKLARKRGFHLCLVETREGNFHMNVPEL